MKSYTLHGYTIQFHGYGAWDFLRPDGSRPEDWRYHRTYRRVVEAVKRDLKEQGA